MTLCQRCKGDTVINIERNGKIVGVMTCPKCQGSGWKPTVTIRIVYAFCGGLALAWCSTADAQSPWPPPDAQLLPPNGCVGQACDSVILPGTIGSGTPISRPEDAAKVDLDHLKEAVKQLKDEFEQLEVLLHALLQNPLPDCIGEPPEHLPCIERQ